MSICGQLSVNQRGPAKSEMVDVALESLLVYIITNLRGQNESVLIKFGMVGSWTWLVGFWIC